MKNLFEKLFRRRITFGNDIYNFVNVIDSDERDKKNNDLFSGLIKSIDFERREVCVADKMATYTISFDNIVTISRMRDHRLRMWIKKEGE